MDAYESLERRFRRVMTLREVDELLYWDSAVVMPAGGADARAEQQAVVQVLEHETLTHPAVADLLAQAEEESAELDEWSQANLREMRRMWAHATAVEPALVEAMARSITLAEQRWRVARPANDFQGLRPALEEVVLLTRRVAEARAAALGTDPYQALIDEHDPGRSHEEIEGLFAKLARQLPELLGSVLEAQRSRPAPEPLAGPFPIEQQRQLSLRIIEQAGFDLAHGHFAISPHPFCTSTPDDVRITTRYDEADFTHSLGAVQHETGHALYERGTPAPWRRQPVGAPRGAGLHESQAVLLDREACRTRSFVQFLAPLVREIFDRRGAAWEADNLYRHLTKVEAGPIRVGSDEVTGIAHILLRYRLEKALISEELAVRDLPGAWNDASQELLGLVPPDDAHGCMQDSHWFGGVWGYFPSYALGALTAAQLFAAARRDMPTIEPGLAKGNFAPLLEWLGEHVHRWGSRYEVGELVERATGKPLGVDAFVATIHERHLGSN